jgi:hypothetical protein
MVIKKCVTNKTKMGVIIKGVYCIQTIIYFDRAKLSNLTIIPTKSTPILPLALK